MQHDQKGHAYSPPLQGAAEVRERDFREEAIAATESSEETDEELRSIQIRILEAEWLEDHELFSLCTKELEQLLLLRIARAEDDARSGELRLYRMRSDLERHIVHKVYGQTRCAAAASTLIGLVQDLEDTRLEYGLQIQCVSDSLHRCGALACCAAEFPSQLFLRRGFCAKICDLETDKQARVAVPGFEEAKKRGGELEKSRVEAAEPGEGFVDAAP